MLSPKAKGNLTELQCILSFYKMGCTVSIPYGDNSRYDFIADICGKLLRIQCKTSRLVENKNSSGSIEFNTYTKSHNSEGFHTKNYSTDEIDFFATYWNEKCYLIPVQECGTSSKKLRVAPAKNNNNKNINFAEDYEAEKQIKIFLEKMNT